MVFIGMPGTEKRLSWYPQLYSRVGVVHAFRPLSAAEVRGLLQHQWVPIARIVEINALSQVTREVVEAARESLVIGTA
jgi:hypothetical protein